MPASGLASGSIQINARSILDGYIKDITVDTPLNENDSIPMLNNIIDGLDRTYDDIKRNVENFSGYITNIQSNDDLLSKYLDNMYNTLIEPYIKQALTAQEFNSLQDKFIKCIDSIASVYSNMQVIVLNYNEKIKANIDIYSIIYQIVDEATLRGQIDNEEEPKKDK